jgi:cell division septum initiation protein DivIVA
MSDGIETATTTTEQRGTATDLDPAAPQEATGELVPGMTAVEEEPRAGRTPAGHVDQFAVVLRGYDRHQVDDYLSQLGTYVAQLREDLAQALAREEATGLELSQVRAELERGRPSFDALGERVSQLLGLAETEADQLRASARSDAEETRASAERDAAQVRSDARRDADELAESTRSELADLGRLREDLLGDLAEVRASLEDVLARSTRRIDLSDAAAPAPVEESGVPANGDNEPY